MKEEKALWRTKMRKLQKMYSPETVLHYSQIICDKIEGHSIFQAAKTIFFTSPIHGEVDLIPLAEKYFLTKKICFPRILNAKSGLMEARNITSTTELSETMFDILEPSKNSLLVSPYTIDLFLIPALAVDIRGNRLGSGKGFFDRFLKKRKGFVIATLFDEQVFEHIPKEPQEEKVDEIITEKRTIRIANL